MRDEKQIWIDEHAKLPIDKTPGAGAKRIATLLNERVTGKQSIKDATLGLSPKAKFTWQKPIFQAIMEAVVTPALDPVVPLTILATAWGTACLASTMIITSGAEMSPPPPGTNGIVGTAIAIIDPPSVAIGQAYIIAQLLLAPKVGEQKESKFPVVMYEAFGFLTYTITGIDTKTPEQAGPVPFILPLTPTA